MASLRALGWRVQILPPDNNNTGLVRDDDDNNDKGLSGLILFCSHHFQDLHLP